MDLQSDLSKNILIGNSVKSKVNGALNYEEAFPPLNNNCNDSSEANSSSRLSHHNNNNSNGINHSPKRLPPVVKAQSYIKVANSLTIAHSEFKFKSSSSGNNDSNASKICQDIGKRFNVSISIRQGSGSVTFDISGKNENAVSAKAELVRVMTIQVEETVTVAKIYHGYICGKSGSRVKDLEIEYGVRINMPSTSSNIEEIMIQGTSIGVEAAKKRILLIYQEQSRRASEDLIIPKKHHPFICGPYSRNLEKLRSQYNIKINVPPTHVNSDLITLNGDSEGVAIAMKQFKAINEQMEKLCTSANITVPKSQHRFIVGLRGAGLSEILEMTGVSVEMPSAEDSSESLTLRGLQDKIGSALTMTLARANSVQEQIIECPSFLQRFLIGKGGSNLSKIRGPDNEKVRIDFLDNDGSGKKMAKIVVEGPSEGVRDVVCNLEKNIADLKLSMDYADVKVPIKYLKHIVGKSGSNVSQLQREYDVSIRVPTTNSGDDSDFVRIEGNPTGVQGAKETIEALLYKLENEMSRDLLIDHAYFKEVLNFRELREKYPNVNVWCPDANNNEDNDIVQIRGPRSDVNEAETHIMSLYNKIADVIDVTVPIRNMKEMFNGESFLTYVLHSIQTEVGGTVQLFIAAKDKSSVEIVGPKVSAKKARSLLLDLLKEDLHWNYDETLQCSPSLFRTLKGNGGTNLLDIRRETGARVVFPMLNNNDNDKERHLTKNNNDIVRIIGTQASVGKARIILENKIKELQSSVEKQIEVSYKWHKHFLQRKGQVINQIYQNIGGNLSITFPKGNMVDGKFGNTAPPVLIRGPPSFVDSAIQMILDIVSDLEAQVTIKISIPKVHHRILIGRNGDNVREFEEKHSVKITFPQNTRTASSFDDFDNSNLSDEDDVISINGRIENCESAKNDLLDMIPIEEKIPLFNKYHAMLIGQSGNEIKQIQKRFDIFIQLPSISDSDENDTLSNPNNDYITVNGTNKNIAVFKVELEHLKEKWQSDLDDRNARSYEDTILIPIKYHKSIIGFKGLEIKKLREKFDVHIDMPKIKTTEDVDTAEDQEAQQRVHLHGYKENIEKLKKWFIERVDHLDSLVSEELFVPRETHSRIIGSKGSNLRKILEQFNVDILFPNVSSDGSNKVIVTGTSAKVDECCDYLIDLANEIISDNIERKSIEQIRAKSNQLSYSMSKNKKNGGGGNKNNSNGFQVLGAPWQNGNGSPNMESNDEFPVIRKNSCNNSCVDE